MISFLNIEYFFLIIPLFLLVLFLYFKWGYKINFWPINDIKKIYKWNSFLYRLYYFILLIIFLLYVSIFANPIEKNYKEKVIKNWIDIEILLDVSYSMMAEDLKPNRLEVAKDVIEKFLWWLKNDRVWIIVFSWKPFTSLPLNFDYNIVKKIVNKINIDIINQSIPSMQWTAIWDALLLAYNVFSWDKETNREKIIILITDWEASKWLHPESAIKYIKDKKWSEQIKIYTIWVWWTKDTFVEVKNPIIWNRRLKIWWVDEKMLKKISNETWGKFFRATNKKWLEEIFNTIKELEKKDYETEIIINNNEKHNVFLYLLLFLMFIFIFIKFRKKI